MNRHTIRERITSWLFDPQWPPFVIVVAMYAALG